MRYFVATTLFIAFFAPVFSYDFFHTIDSSGVFAVVWSVTCLTACCGLANGPYGENHNNPDMFEVEEDLTDIL